MSIGIASNQIGTYQVSTPVYEGPLDLLLQLIERAELVGGWLDIESGPDGTTIYVDIPQTVTTQ